jgi:site-specific recombinase XerD
MFLTDKAQNKNILQLAKNIKNEYELKLHTTRFGFNVEKSKNTNFCQYFYNIVESKQQFATKKSWKGALNVFKDFAGEEVTFADVDEVFCNKFLDYLQNRTVPYKNTKLENSSINSHLTHLSFVIKRALEDKIIVSNPLLKIKKLKVKSKENIYLTLEELRLLVDTDFRYPVLKQAVNFLGEREKDNEKVFKLRPYKKYKFEYLKKWCADAGVNKKITYHSSRHTFAVLQLTYGTNIFVVQKLLGHSSISSTMVYANIVDTEKEKAMNVIPSVF